MIRRASHWACVFVVGLCVPSEFSQAQLPTTVDVLAAYESNLDRLRCLHLQMVNTQEWTQAWRDKQLREIDQYEFLLKHIESGELTTDNLDANTRATGITIEQLKSSVQGQLEASRALANNDRFQTFLEIFIAGDDYQVRSPNGSFDENKAEWKFPSTPLNATSLVSDYAAVRIYSRSSVARPPAQIWCGPDDAAMILTGHVGSAQSQNLPPFVAALHPEWDQRHPIDEFFSAPKDRYRVVKKELVDGVELVVVDALVPKAYENTWTDSTGKTQHGTQDDFYRAWLDLRRGAIPMKLVRGYRPESTDFDEQDFQPPFRVVATKEVRELANGAYYPAVTVSEDFRTPPSADYKTSPPMVYERLTCNCSLVETITPADNLPFVLPLPEHHPIYDWDAKKVIGALERAAPVKPGQPAPPLSLARWLDGKQRTLEDFRGQVVVIDFWGLWCSACRNAVPSLKEVQQHFHDQPVTFIAIHTGEPDEDALMTRIQQYADDQGWQFLQAIDSGTMRENSRSSCAYGVNGFPCEVVIDANGVVVFNSDIPPAGMEDIVGKSCEELSTEDEARFAAYLKRRFDDAGVPWPVDDTLSQTEQIERVNQVHTCHLKQEIEKALDAKN